MPKTCKDCTLTYIDNDTYFVEGVRCCVLKRCCIDIIDKDKTCPLIKIDALDKIRAEIEEYKSRTVFGIGIKDLETGKQVALDNVLGIIDKYKAESEDKVW